MRERGCTYHCEWDVISLPAKCPSNGVSLRTNDGPTLNAGLAALLFISGSGQILLRNLPYIFVILGGGGSGLRLNLINST